MTGPFDDLIPAASGASQDPAAVAGPFDDLIPATSAAPVAPRAAPAGMFDDLIPASSKASDPIIIGADDPIPLDTFNDTARMMANGASLGFADRIAAGVGALTGIGGKQGDYAGNLDAQRAEDARVKATDPVAPLQEGIGSVIGMAAGPAAAIVNAARDAGIAGRAAAGAVTGGTVGAAQGASQSSDLTDIPQTAADAYRGAREGAELGLGLPIVGSAAGGAYRTVAPFLSEAPAGLSRTATGLISNAIRPETGGQLATLGPNGTLADTSPAALGLTQGIAAKGGAGADIAVGNLANRAAGQSGRLLGSLDDNLGPAFSPRQAQQMVTDRQAAASPLYEQALNNAPPAIDITPVTQQLENARLYAKGTDAARLDRFGQLLQGPQRVGGMAQPEYDPRALQRAKFEMDAQIEGVNNQTGSAAATATRDMVGVRNALNTAMEQQIPGYADANLAWGAAQRAGQAFTAGRQALKPGAETLWPADLDQQFGALPLEQQAMMRSGARSEIAAGLGTNPNDLSSLNKVVGGENDFNRPKMATLFGPEQTANVIQDVGNERTFADTYNKVAQGSQTAQRSGNAAAIDSATPSFVIPKSASLAGLLGHGGEYLVRRGFGTLAQNMGDSTRQQLAQALTAPGPQASANLRALSQALMSRDQNAAAIRAGLSDPATLAAGLYAYQSATQ